VGRLSRSGLIDGLMPMANETPISAIPAVKDIPHVPTHDDEVVFNNPWEAKAFALVVHLCQQGHFTWTEWAERLGEEIKAAGADDDGSQYYLLWLTAAEKLTEAKSICSRSEFTHRKMALESEQTDRTDQTAS
jgi:nitrile hydratase accessory protein